MPNDERLLARIRGEYQEMPGLHLSLAQACRLWQLDGTTCLALFEQLVAERHLRRTHDGKYVAFPSTRPKPAKAPLAIAHPTGVKKRHHA